MRLLLKDAKLPADAIDYINTHGTSTPVGDMNELTAIRRVFGNRATNGLLISSTKSMTGHLLGAAGGLEAVLCAFAVRDGIVPPTINLDNPDEGAVGLDLVPHTARRKELRYVISNSFGFGGTNVSLAMGRHD
jgi:3-oxoacyl-[acyl-carrier-protein] synthase II